MTATLLAGGVKGWREGYIYLAFGTIRLDLYFESTHVHVYRGTALVARHGEGVRGYDKRVGVEGHEGHEGDQRHANHDDRRVEEVDEGELERCVGLR